MTFFEKLTKETQNQREKLYQNPLILSALQGKISLQTYVNYLTEAYHHVKHTTPLLMLTGSKMSEKQEFLRNALAEYIEEELGHQEWILNDIANCGFDKEIARHSKPNMATDLMISYAYDFVNRKNPVGFFGMVFVLEGTSTSLATNAGQSIMDNLKLEKNCFSYLFSHGTLDIKHMEFFENLVNKITEKDDQDAITSMAQTMFLLFDNMLSSVITKN
jgi:pyrroloquinoline quinone (PQQ) biosynthesis protein C